MLLGCISTLAMIGTAIAAGLGYLSFWWTLIPAFLAGSFALSNGPGYERIIQANEEGRLSYFPTALAVSVGFSMAIAAVVFWITRAVAN